jgi:GNAT superfamily N-acetyltransferase
LESGRKNGYKCVRRAELLSGRFDACVPALSSIAPALFNTIRKRGPTLITIRPATISDTADIARLIRALAEYEKLTHLLNFDENRLREHLFGARPYAEALLAEIEGAVAGFALYFHNYSTFLAQPGIYLEDLFVEPQHRGRGVGKALLAALAKVAVERNCGRMEWCALDWNEPAITFYESLGARPLDETSVFRLTGPALARLAAGAPAPR